MNLTDVSQSYNFRQSASRLPAVTTTYQSSSSSSPIIISHKGQDATFVLNDITHGLGLTSLVWYGIVGLTVPLHTSLVISGMILWSDDPTLSYHRRMMVSQPCQGPIPPVSAHQKKVKNVTEKFKYIHCIMKTEDTEVLGRYRTKPTTIKA